MDRPMQENNPGEFSPYIYVFDKRGREAWKDF